MGRLTLLSAHMMASHSARPEDHRVRTLQRLCRPHRRPRQEETRRLNHNYVGSEHLLLALTGDKSWPARPSTDTLGVTHAAATSGK